MLKKLAKYGNSTALVIDKAILEILEIEDGGLVKLQTDGKSLIITPVRATPEVGKASYGVDEALQGALNTMMEKGRERLHEITAEQHVQFQQEMKVITDKYEEAFKKYLHVAITPEFREKISKISEKYDPIAQMELYGAELNRLKYQVCPELEKMDHEMEMISQKYYPKK